MGSLVFVGTGLQLAGHISVRSKDYIEKADIVFTLVPESNAQHWVEGLNDNIVDLQPFYAQKGEIKSRRDTYKEMVEAILAAVRKGKKTVCALYGHPGVFACISHIAIAQAKEEGFDAYMEPGISAEACLWADVGIDPGRTGHQSFEASQFMFYKHTADPTTHLLLWQIAVAGEHTLTKFNTNSKRLRVLVEQLSEWYPLDHEVIIYEAANLPVFEPRIERIPLEQLPYASLKHISTLVIPPAKKLEYNFEVMQKLGITPEDLG